ncbi:5635_t:CDS:2 [Paraglomus occultum]|uniref:5635_t:CDS:1 n=1 Tax=Paraglomus occultum TaxID=144539 RepID=A0A9N8YSJ9_9GLOM|nr:5635_t:CDS:2 [Paraglomus occultum]
MASAYATSLPSDSVQPTQQNLTSPASESTPLLRSSDIIYEDIPLNDAPDDMTYDFKEAAFIFRKAVPIALTYLIEFSLHIVSVITLGHLGSVELASSALASMFASVTGWSIAFGAATALDTLCSQAFTSVVWLNAESILIFLGQREDLARYAGLFLRCLLCGAPAFVMFECLKKYLQAQGIVKAPTYVLVIAATLNICLNYLLVWYEPFSLGFIGAPIATATTYWFMLILLIGYIRYFDGYQVWGGWTRQCLSGWGEVVMLAVPGIFMICSEWWAFELIALAAGYFGETALAAQSVILTTGSTLFQFPFGVAVSASNRVGNLIGAGLVKRAQISSRMAMILAVIVGGTTMSLLLVCRHSWGYLFTGDKDVVELVASVLPMCAAFQISDALGTVGGGIIRGLGRQKIGATLNIIAYYFIGLPFSLVTAFIFEWRLIGLWAGLMIGSMCVGAGELILIMKTNWGREAENVRIRFLADNAKTRRNNELNREVGNGLNDGVEYGNA